MKKLLLLTLILITALFHQPIYASPKNEVLVAVNDNMIEFTDIRGKSFNDTIYVPLREFAQALGIAVVQEEQGEVLSLNRQNKEIKLNTKEKALVKENQITIPCDIVNEGGTSLVPARTLAEYFNYTVRYIPSEKVLRVIDQNATLTDKEFTQKYQEAIDKYNAKTVYLTFDDGPNDYTLKILDLLGKYEMKATFFMLDDRMKARPEIVQKVLEEGHAIGLHGVSHEKDIFYRGLHTPLNEMNTANGTLEGITGKRSALIRMPYGSVPYLTNAQYNLLTDYGYRIWDWHVDSRDWASKDPNIPYQSVVSQLKDTCEEAPVILFHDRETTIKVLEKTLAWMDKNGYTSEYITKTMKPKTFKKIK